MKARKVCGLTQRELALRLNKPRSFVSKIESCERRLDIVEFTAIARALELAPGELMQAIASSLPNELEF